MTDNGCAVVRCLKEQLNIGIDLSLVKSLRIIRNPQKCNIQFELALSPILVLCNVKFFFDILTKKFFEIYLKKNVKMKKCEVIKIEILTFFDKKCQNVTYNFT